jgi:hypothetical protein
MKVIPTNNPPGILHIAESKAICPYCDNHFDINWLDEKWYKAKNNKGAIRVKCSRCKRFVGITMDITGDFIAYDLH